MNYLNTLRQLSLSHGARDRREFGVALTDRYVFSLAEPKIRVWPSSRKQSRRHCKT